MGLAWHRPAEPLPAASILRLEQAVVSSDRRGPVAPIAVTVAPERGHHARAEERRVDQYATPAVERHEPVGRRVRLDTESTYPAGHRECVGAPVSVQIAQPLDADVARSAETHEAELVVVEPQVPRRMPSPEGARHRELEGEPIAVQRG